MTEKQIYQEAIKAWGIESQIMVAIEEMAELTKELIKNYRGRPNGAELREEIADVKIMISQLELMFDADEDLIEDYKIYKLGRLQKMLEKQEGP
jgi:NTP pyrophosphatase (non-canonical NTP hydrolase)